MTPPTANAPPTQAVVSQNARRSKLPRLHAMIDAMSAATAMTTTSRPIAHLRDAQASRAFALGALPFLGDEHVATRARHFVAGDADDHARLARLADVDARIG